MNIKVVTLASLFFGLGCSHAPAKTQSPMGPVVSAPRSALPARVSQQTEEREQKQISDRDDSAGNAIFFDFDSADLRQDARPTLQKIGEKLTHSKASIRIEGNCDERGTTEYNIALGDRRAREARQYLERLGIPGKRISIVSYGSERPKYLGHDETAWAKNRRDDLVVR